MQLQVYTVIKIISAIFLSLLPIVIWVDLLQHIRKTDKKTRLTAKILFILGCSSVLFTLGIQYIWSLHPALNLEDIFQKKFPEFGIGALISIFMFASFEEISKIGVVALVNSFRHTIVTVNQAVFFGIMSALGFAFVENAIYFARTIISGNLIDLFFVFSFRSLFTTAAHSIFSGIFGYFLAIALFSKSFYRQSKLEGHHYPIIHFFNKLFKIQNADLYKQRQILTGFFMASSLHSVFNLLLANELMTETFILVLLGAFYVMYLMKHKAGFLLLGNRRVRKSMMAQKDEEVIIELLGMWLNEEKYAEVEEICARLLERDPDNKVVQLFMAKAHDRKKFKKVLHHFKNLFKENPQEIDFEESFFERMEKQKKENL